MPIQATQSDLMWYIEVLGKALFHILPALVTVGLGAWLIQRFFVSRANQAAFIDVLVGELDVIREDSLEYWTNHQDANGKKDTTNPLTQKIKGSIKSVNSDLIYFCERYRLANEKKTHITTLMTDMADACTGGSFESKRKDTDKDRYLLIVNAINQLRSELFRMKL